MWSTKIKKKNGDLKGKIKIAYVTCTKMLSKPKQNYVCCISYITKYPTKNKVGA